MRDWWATHAKALATAAIAVVAVAALVLVGVALSRDSAPEPENRESPALRLSVIGDSYSTGLNNNVVWPDLAEQATGWDVDNVSVFGAGYVGGGTSGTFAEQTDAAVSGRPNAILVFGGLNDIGKPPELVTQRATDLLADVARSAPGARIIVMGPAWHELPVPEAAQVIDDSVRDAAEALDLPFISVVGRDWLVPDGLIQEDGVHPTDAGQRILAERIAETLQTTGVPFV